MDEVFVTESGTTEVLSPVLDVELVDLGPTNTELIFVGDVGIQGPRGDIGPNPMTVSATPPANPQIGDLWYQP